MSILVWISSEADLIQGFKSKYLFCNVIMKNTGKGIRSEIQNADTKERIIKAVILRWATRA